MPQKQRKAGALPPPNPIPSPAYVRASALDAGVDPDIAEEMVGQESARNPRAKSSKGAMGFTQLMPNTARSLGVKNPYDPYENLDGGLRYLRQGYDDGLNRGASDPERYALSYYNAGPGAVRKYGQEVPYKETTNYRNKIQGRANRRRAALPPPAYTSDSYPPKAEGAAPASEPTSTYQPFTGTGMRLEPKLMDAAPSPVIGFGRKAQPSPATLPAPPMQQESNDVEAMHRALPPLLPDLEPGAWSTRIQDAEDEADLAAMHQNDLLPDREPGAWSARGQREQDEVKRAERRQQQQQRQAITRQRQQQATTEAAITKRAADYSGQVTAEEYLQGKSAADSLSIARALRHDAETESEKTYAQAKTQIADQAERIAYARLQSDRVKKQAENVAKGLAPDADIDAATNPLNVAPITRLELARIRQSLARTKARRDYLKEHPMQRIGENVATALAGAGKATAQLGATALNLGVNMSPDDSPHGRFFRENYAKLQGAIDEKSRLHQLLEEDLPPEDKLPRGVVEGVLAMPRYGLAAAAGGLPAIIATGYGEQDWRRPKDAFIGGTANAAMMSAGHYAAPLITGAAQKGAAAVAERLTAAGVPESGALLAGELAGTGGNIAGRTALGAGLGASVYAGGRYVSDLPVDTKELGREAAKGAVLFNLSNPRIRLRGSEPGFAPSAGELPLPMPELAPGAPETPTPTDTAKSRAIASLNRPMPQALGKEPAKVPTNEPTIAPPAPAGDSPEPVPGTAESSPVSVAPDAPASPVVDRYALQGASATRLLAKQQAQQARLSGNFRSELDDLEAHATALDTLLTAASEEDRPVLQVERDEVNHRLAVVRDHVQQMRAAGPDGERGLMGGIESKANIDVQMGDHPTINRAVEAERERANYGPDYERGLISGRQQAGQFSETELLEDPQLRQAVEEERARVNIEKTNQMFPDVKQVADVGERTGLAKYIQDTYGGLKADPKSGEWSEIARARRGFVNANAKFSPDQIITELEAEGYGPFRDEAGQPDVNALQQALYHDTVLKDKQTAGAGTKGNVSSGDLNAYYAEQNPDAAQFWERMPEQLVNRVVDGKATSYQIQQIHDLAKQAGYSFEEANQFIKEAQGDFNASVPDAPRAGDVASAEGYARDIQPVLEGRRVAGSMHADAVRGGLEQFEQLVPQLKQSAEAAGLSYGISGKPGEQRHAIVYDEAKVAAIMQRHGLSPDYYPPANFLADSFHEVFPVGSAERAAIDEIYGEPSQPGVESTYEQSQSDRTKGIAQTDGISDTDDRSGAPAAGESLNRTTSELQREGEAANAKPESSYNRLLRENADEIDTIREIGLSDPRGKRLMQAIRAYARETGIEARHVNALETSLMNEEMDRAKEADRQAREAKIRQLQANDQTVENLQSLIQGELSNANIQEFQAGAKEAGFSNRETAQITTLAKRIARENQTKASRAKREYYQAGARSRQQIWERERDRLTSTYGGKFYYESESGAHDIDVEVYNRTGKGQLRVILRDRDGYAFDQFNSSESELEAGLLGEMGYVGLRRATAPAVASFKPELKPMASVMQMPDSELADYLSEMERIERGLQAYRHGMVPGAMGTPTAMNAVSNSDIADFRQHREQVETYARNIRQLTTPREELAPAKYRDEEWMALSPAERRTRNQAAARAWLMQQNPAQFNKTAVSLNKTPENEIKAAEYAKSPAENATKVLFNAERHVGDIKEGPSLGVFLAPEKEIADKYAAGKGRVRAYEVSIKKPLRLTADDSIGLDEATVEHINEQLRQAGVKYKFEDYDPQEIWRYFDQGGKKFVNAVKRAGYDAIVYTDAIGAKPFESTLVFDKQALREAVMNDSGNKPSGLPESLAKTQDNIPEYNQNNNQPPRTAFIDVAAHEAATSPHNNLPEPTDAQKEAGNYKLGHINIHGLDISIENPKGSIRSKIGKGGKSWSVEMKAHYGYLKRTEGADGDHVDVYIGENPQSDKVFVVDQVEADSKKFDEHKVILGADSQAEATKLYDAHFDDGRGPDRRGAITEMGIAQFKDWLKSGDTTKPIDAALQERTITTDVRPAQPNRTVSPVNRTVTDDRTGGQPGSGSLFDEAEPAETGVRAGRSDADRHGDVPAQRPGGVEPATTGKPTTNTETTAPGARRRNKNQSGTPSLFELSEGATQSSAAADTVIQTILEHAPKTDVFPAPAPKPVTVAKPAPEPPKRPEKPRYTLPDTSYRLTPGVIEKINSGGQMTKFRQNMSAIRLLRELLVEGRTPTQEEKDTLALYAGWGGIKTLFEPHTAGRDYADKKKWYDAQTELINLIGDEAFKEARTSIMNAHYTAPELVQAIWAMAERLGFKQGRILEPALGVGNFFGLAPTHIREHSSFTGIEKDSTTGQIARLLYPDADVQIKGFEELKAPDNFYDLVISNVPFGDYRVGDPRYDKHAAAIHNYFFLKALDKVKPGGLVMMITSTGTMDAPRAEGIRRTLHEQADLVSAIRFPAETFKKNALTSVVTDLVILRKRLPGEPSQDASWVKSGKAKATDDYEVSVNNWLVAHPKNMLGKFIGRHPQYAARAGLERTSDFEQLFADAIQRLPQNIFNPGTAQRAANNATGASQQTKTGGLEVKDAKLYRNTPSGLLEEVKADASTVRKAERMLNIRNILNRLTDATMGRTTDDPTALRTELNQAYDRFKDSYGPLTKNKEALKGDPDLPRLLALEDYNPKSKTAMKRAIFKADSIVGLARNVQPTNVTEALVKSLHETGLVDVPQIAEQLQVPIEAVRLELPSKGLAFQDPAGAWEVGAKYLSGNVRVKLAEAREAAKTDAYFELNVKALEAVQPPDVAHSDISVRLGASWLDPATIRQFVAETVGAEPEEFSVHYDKPTGKWLLDVQTNARATRTAEATSTWGTPRANFFDLVQHALDGTEPRLNDKVNDKIVFNPEATNAAATKLQAIRERFADWVWENEARKTKLITRYNEQLNSLRSAEYDPTPFLNQEGGATVPGLNANWSLRPHQYAAVMRSVTEKRGIFAHEVGLGKTLAMIASASEMKRLGISRKPAIAVPKKVLPGFVQTAQDAFPLLKIHVVDSSDADARKLSVSQIATGEHDLIMMTHDNLDMLKLRPEFEAKILQKELDEVDAVYQAMLEMMPPEAKKNKRSPENKILEKINKRRESLKAKIKEATTSGRKDDTTYFEDTGIDTLFVDEFHKYKSLPITTTMGNVKGVPTGDSQRAINMLMRARYLQELQQGGGLFAATGTPVSNSLAEAYVMAKFMQPDVMEQAGVNSFDAWARNFAEPVTSLELTATGEWEPQTRLAKFNNLPELQLLSRATLDVKTAKATGILEKRPQRLDRTVTVPMSEGQRLYLKHLQERAEAIKRKEVEPSEDNFLVVSNDGRQMASDMRMVVPNFQGDAGGKVKALVDEVLRIHKAKPNTTQMIFSDTGVSANAWGYRLYDDIINRLAEAGIARDKIIDFSKLDSDAKVEKAVSRLNSADAIIAIGHRENMGTGINAQRRMAAVHQFDVPWKPALIEQSEARGWRQDNENKDVEILSYVTEGSFDAVMWATVARKQQAIQQFMAGDSVGRSIEEADDGALSYDQIAAAASGDLDYLRRAELQAKVFKLQLAERNHESEKSNRRSKTALLTTERELVAKRLPIAEKIQELSKAAREKDFSYVDSRGKHYTDREDAARFLVSEYMFTRQGRMEKKLGEYKGIPITTDGMDHMYLQFGNDSFSQVEVTPNLEKMVGTLASIDQKIASESKGASKDFFTKRLSQIDADLAAYEKAGTGEFPAKAELEAARAELKAVEERLAAKQSEGGRAELTTTQGQDIRSLSGQAKMMRELRKAEATQRRNLKKLALEQREQGAVSIDALLPDYAIKAAEHIGRGGKNFFRWAIPYLKQFGEKLRGVLRQAWALAQEFYRDERGMLDLAKFKQFLKGKGMKPQEEIVPVAESFSPNKLERDIDAILEKGDFSSEKKAQIEKLLDEALTAFDEDDGAKLMQARRELNDALRGKSKWIADLFRPMMAVGELGYFLRQGGYPFLSFFRASLPSIGKAKQAWTEAGYNKVLAEMEGHEWYEQAQKSGLSLSTPHEFNVSQRLLGGEEGTTVSPFGKLPYIKQVEQANKAFLDTQRLNVFAEGASLIEEVGGTPEELEAGWREWAKEVNRMSGRGNVQQKYEGAANLGAYAIWSPRFMLSRLQLFDITRFRRQWKKNPKAAKLAMRGAVRLVGLMATLGVLAYLTADEVGLDPDDANFLKARYGKTRYSIVPFGMGTYVTLGARMVKHAWNYAHTQDTVEIKNAGKQLATFGRFKEAPGFGFVHDQLDRHRDKGGWETFGHNALGEQKTLLASAYERVLPMYLKSVWDAGQVEGVGGVVKQVPNYFGWDAQTYDEKEYVGRPPEPRSKKLSAPLERAIRRSVYDEIGQDPFYRSLPKPYQEELMERQMGAEVYDAEAGKGRSPDFRSRSYDRDASVVAGLRDLHTMPMYKGLSREQQKQAESAYFKAMQWSQGTRESERRGESLPLVPSQVDIAEALDAAMRAVR